MEYLSQSGENNTSVKFTPWDKINYQSKNSPEKEYEESKQTIPAFGMTISKSGGNTFKLSLEPGECECLISFLRYLIQKFTNIGIINQTEQKLSLRGIEPLYEQKKKILFYSNHCKAFTGFGKNSKKYLKAFTVCW